MKLYDKSEKIIWIIFWILVFAGLSVFFQKYHPLTIFDTDDWTYVKFTRRSGGIFPSTKEFNPIKVLPENMMAFAGFFGAYLIKPFCGDYVRSLEISCSMFYCVTITIYIFAIVAAIKRKHDLDLWNRILLALFILFAHFVPLLTKEIGNTHFFYEVDTTHIYNYTIPTLFNVITICYSFVYEEKICELDIKNHKSFFILYVVLIYLSINSNLYCNILIASYAFSKLAQYLIEKKRVSKSLFKGKHCIFILVMWCGSLIFEYNGARASQIGRADLDMVGTIKQLLYSIIEMNKLYLAASIIMLIGAIILYFKEKSTDCIIEVIPLYVLSGCLTTVFIVLLSSKIDKTYLTNPAVQLTFCFFFLMTDFTLVANIININRIASSLVFLITALMSFFVVFSKPTFAEINAMGLAHDKSIVISHYIIDQYMEAYAAGKSSVEIRVPCNDNNASNFPFCDYGAERIASNLWWHGMTKYKMKAVFIPDKAINVMYDL